MSYKPEEVGGHVTLSLEAYEKWKTHNDHLEKRLMIGKEKVEQVRIASEHLSQFFSHISKKVENFDDLISAFNSSSEACEIQKMDDGKYKVVVTR